MDAYTLTHDEHFTIAADAAGRSYRVLLTTGLPDAYRLEPIRAGYRGRTIAEGHPLYEPIRVAEDERQARERARPIDPAKRWRCEQELA